MQHFCITALIATLLHTTHSITLGKLACMIYSKSDDVEFLNTVLIMEGNLIQWKQYTKTEKGEKNGKRGQSKVGFGIVWNPRMIWSGIESKSACHEKTKKLIKAKPKPIPIFLIKFQTDHNCYIV